LALFLSFSNPVKALPTYITFESEEIISGAISNSANRNISDSNYETLTQLDQLNDINYSMDSDSVSVGSMGFSGGASIFPDAINSYDDQYRTYIEENLGGGGGGTVTIFIVPNGDSSVQWTRLSGSYNYEMVDDSGTDSTGDGDTTYVSTGTNNYLDYYTLSDILEPDSGYNIDVTLYAVHKKMAAQGNSFTSGITITGTNYVGITVSPTNGVWTNSSSSVWTINPKTSSEWIYTDINSLIGYVTSTDASPTVYCTKLVIKVYITIPADADLYNVMGEIDLDSSTDDENTVSFIVKVQAKCSDSEDYYIQIYDFTALEYNTRITVTGLSDADYSYELTSDEFGVSGDVNFKFYGSSEISDTTQSTLSVDFLRIEQMKNLYNSSVNFTCSFVPVNGNITLNLKGFTDDGENWFAKIWNYTTSSFDDLFTINTEINTLESTLISREDNIDSGVCIVRINNTNIIDFDSSEFALDWLVIYTDYISPEEPEPETDDLLTSNQMLIFILIAAILGVTLIFAFIYD
jgi:hypothetical protein